MTEQNISDRLHLDDEVEPAGRIAALRLLEDDVCGFVDYRTSVESTNTLALAQLIQLGAETNLPRLCLADQQTAGRGRHGRQWISNAETLTFSLAVDRPQKGVGPVELAPLAVGVGIARFLEFEFAPTQVRLKWPNDVHIGGGKVAGILIETSSTRANVMVVGVGINAGEGPELETGDATQRARGLTAVLGRSIRRYDLLYGIVSHLLQSIAEVEDAPDELLHEYRTRCLLVGHRIDFQDGATRREGLCRGISDDGGLMVETASGLRCLQSGEANLVRSRT